MSKRRFIVWIALMLRLVDMSAQQAVRPDVLLLERVFRFKASVDTTATTDSVTYAYRKFYLNVERRNVLLLPVPTMYRIAHGPRREYIEETYERITQKGLRQASVNRMVFLSTIPRRKQTMATLMRYLTPNLYNETIFGTYVLSPFHRANKIYYKYTFKYLYKGKVSIHFRPKINHTQLVEGNAIVDSSNGQILNGQLTGEYDMVKYHLFFTMGTEGVQAMLPTKCELQSEFNFIGNKIVTHHTAAYGLPCELPDTLRDKEDPALMAAVRRDTLTAAERAVYEEVYGEEAMNRPRIVKKRSWAKRVFWDILGDNLLNKITSNYGTDKQGYVRINPLFNPLYMGYSGRKGYYYKFDIRNFYNFSDSSYLYTRLKAGYSFKQKHMYYTLPIAYHFNKKRHGYVEMVLSNGNWIRNGHVKDQMLETLPDTVMYNGDRIDYFRDLNISLNANYDLSSRLSLQTGMVVHRREAVERHAYRMAGVPTSYTSVAPKFEIIWRPTGWRGPVVNAAYERSIRGLFNADIAYERWEFDIQHIKPLDRLRSLSFRAGCGFYTLIDGSKSFLDYTNFRDNNIPDGWNDEWTGEFSLLSGDWYNLSRYYVRSNVTYESPLLIVGWMPWVGRFFEKERLYASALVVTHLHPYIEVGYGFTTRWASMGLFMANRNGKYDGFGVKVGLELFRQW